MPYLLGKVLSLSPGKQVYGIVPRAPQRVYRIVAMQEGLDA